MDSTMQRELFETYVGSTAGRPCPPSLDTRPWAWPATQTAADSTARRGYLGLAHQAVGEGFPERATRTALGIGHHLGLHDADDAAWAGFGHLTAHLAACELAASLATHPDDRLRKLVDRVVSQLWPAADRVREPVKATFDAGHDLYEHLQRCDYLDYGKLEQAEGLDLLSRAATSGVPQDATTVYPAAMSGLTQAVNDMEADPAGRAPLIRRAVEQVLLP